MVIYEGCNEKGEQFWDVGSGSFVCPNLVLTASHCIPGPGKLFVRRPGDERDYPAVVRLQADKDKVDLAVLEVSDVEVEVPELHYGKVDQDVSGIVKECRAIGFPWFKKRDDKPGAPRFSLQIDGEIPTGENLGQPFLTLQVGNKNPQSRPSKSEWAGISGAVVFSSGDILVGVITEHHRPEGESALTVVPITAIKLLPDAMKWWQLLGVHRRTFLSLPNGTSLDTWPGLPDSHIPGYWEQCNGPHGAVVRTLIVDLHDTKILYAGMTGGGRLNGIYKSVNGGQSWKAIGNSLANRLLALAISYHDNKTIYAGTDQGLFVSRDQGHSWRLSENLPESEVRSVALSPQDSKLRILGLGKEFWGMTAGAGDVIGVSGDGFQPKVILDESGPGDLCVSSDEGSTWTTTPIHNINAIAISPQDSSIIYLGTSDEGVFKRMGSAKGWLQTSPLEAPHVFSLGVSPQDTQHVLVGTNQGLYMSRVGGDTWQKIKEVGDAEVSTITFAPQDGNQIYVGSEVGVFESLDKGASWHEANKGLTHLWVLSLAPLPDGALYAGTNGGGIFKKGRNETSWQPCNDVLTSLPGLSLQMQDSNKIYVGTFAGLFRSENGGNSWQEVGYFNSKPVWSLALVVPITTRHSDMMDAGDLFISTDEGHSWQGQQNQENPAKTLYVGTEDGCIYRSTDGAFSWKKCGELGYAPVWSITIAPPSGNRIYATCDGSMFGSTNKGETWQPVKNGLDGIYVVDVVVSPHDHDVLYAGTGKHGVCKSIDAGSSWQVCNNGLPDSSVQLVALSREDSKLIYAVTEGEGVYKSVDGGNFWCAVNNGLDNLGVTTLVLSPQNGDHLYAGTVEGVYRSTNAGKTWQAFSDGLRKERLINALAFPPEGDSQWLYAATELGVFKVLAE